MYLGEFLSTETNRYEANASMLWKSQPSKHSECNKPACWMNSGFQSMPGNFLEKNWLNKSQKLTMVNCKKQTTESQGLRLQIGKIVA